MRVPAGKNRGRNLARDLCEDFRKARDDAKEALLSNNFQDYLMYSQQMRSMLELEIVEPNGAIFRMITFLTEDEKQNPFMLNESEDIKVSQWIASRLREKGMLQ